MPGLLQIAINKSEIAEVFDDMNKALRTATARAMNQVGRKANREAAKHLKETFNVTQRDLRVNHRVFLRTADSRSLNKFKFVIFVKQVGRGLHRYNPEPTTGGTTVLVKKNRRKIRSAFVSVWKKGQSGRFVFVRDKKEGTYVRKGQKVERTKRRVLFGPSIADLYRRKDTLVMIEKTVQDNFEDTLSEQFDKQFK